MQHKHNNDLYNVVCYKPQDDNYVFIIRHWSNYAWEFCCSIREVKTEQEAFDAFIKMIT